MKKTFAIFLCLVLSFILVSCEDESGKMEQKRIICVWGDSLTTGAGSGGITYPSILQSLLGNNFQVLNCGVGGENTLAIAGRQGGIPMLLARSIELPAGTEEVTIADKWNSFVSSWNNWQVYPLLQGEGMVNTVNRCTIDSVESILRWTGISWDDPKGFYTIRRATPGNSSVVLKEKSVIVTVAMKEYQNVFANIFFVGTNGRYANNADLVAQQKAMIDYSLSKNFVILGLTSGSKSERNELEILMAQEFGENYINLREYLSTQALQDAGITPTQADIQAMAEGKVPPSLLIDHVHFNATGYTLIGKLVYKRLLELGII
jgi:hypothetical protein